MKYYAKKTRTLRPREPSRETTQLQSENQTQIFGAKSENEDARNERADDEHAPPPKDRSGKLAAARKGQFETDEDLLSALEYFKSLGSMDRLGNSRAIKHTDSVKCEPAVHGPDRDNGPSGNHFTTDSSNVWQKIIDRTLSKNSFKISELILDDMIDETIDLLNRLERADVTRHARQTVKSVLVSIKKELNHSGRIAKTGAPALPKQETLDVGAICRQARESSAKHFGVPGREQATPFRHDFRERTKRQICLDGDWMMNVLQRQVEFEDYVVRKNYLTKEYVYANELTLEQIVEEAMASVIDDFVDETGEAVKEVLSREVYTK